MVDFIGSFKLVNFIDIIFILIQERAIVSGLDSGFALASHLLKCVTIRCILHVWIKLR